MSLHQLSGRIRWRIWAGGRGWIWRIRAAVGIGRSRSCRCWSTDVVRAEGGTRQNDRLLPSFKQTPAFYSIYDAPPPFFFFFFSPVSIRRTGDEKPRAPILSSLSNYFRYNRFFLSIYCTFSSSISFVVIDNLARRDENYGFIYSLKGIDYWQTWERADQFARSRMVRSKITRSESNTIRGR